MNIQKDYTPRVNRVYSLPVEAFDYLKARQRLRQFTVDPTAETHTVTNSEALGRVLWDHSQLSTVAGRLNMDVSYFVDALVKGNLTVSRVTPAEAV